MADKKKQKLLLLVCAALVVVTTVFFVKDSAKTQRAPNYELKLRAAQRMERCMGQIKTYKQQRGIALNPLDVHETWMLGEEYNGTTTTLGALEAKRTTANSDMAALVVELLQEAKVKPGDKIAAGFSGSFPSMNLAVLCACAEMQVTPVYIASVGASTFGGNNPTLTFPDMAYLLVRDGFLPTYAAAMTPGGVHDMGEDMDPTQLKPILMRLQTYPIPYFEEPDFQKNLQKRQAIYKENGPIVCYVGVGGNITSIGRSDALPKMGFIRRGSFPRITPKSGLVEIYNASGLDVINLLNIKKLVADYGLPYDPAVLPEPGTSAIYFTSRYLRVPMLVCLICLFALLWRYRKL